MALGDNLQGWWCPSLDTAGNGTTTLTDLSGNGNNGAMINMDAGTDRVADADSGGVLALELVGGSSQYVFIDPFTMPSSWTVAIWCKPDGGVGREGLIGDRVSGGVIGFTVGFNTTVWGLIYGDSVHTTSQDAAADSWQLLSYTFNGATKVGEAFYNGVSLGTHMYSRSPIHAGHLYIGQEGDNSRYFTGRIDGVMVFDAVKSAEEHLALYNGGRSLNLLASGSGNIAHVLASIKQQQESVVVL